MYELPKSLEIDGIFYGIRSDFRAVLDIITALNDTELTAYEKIFVTLKILYVEFDKIVNIQEAFKKAMWFINCGDEEKGGAKRKLMDWEQDFKIIAAPVNRVLGYECRSCEYLHWWTFISAYYEIGECTFSNVVNIRNKKQKGKRLEKWEEEFYRENRNMIDLKQKVTSEEQEIINDIMGIV